MRSRVLPLFCACLSLFAMAPVAAPADDFSTPPIEAEIVQGWDLPDGRRIVGLRLELAKGWKTYWRSPGDAGIPPQFDWSRARNLDGVEIGWPTPEIFVEYGMRSIGYKRNVTLPLTLTPGRADKPIRLRGRMALGVCADVCLPHTLEFEGQVNPGQTARTPELVAALAALPYSASEAEVRSANCQVAPATDGVMITTSITLPDTGGREIVVIEPGNPEIWVSEASTRRDGATLTATSELIHVNGDAFSVNRSDIRITIIGTNYAVDVTGCTAN